MAKISIPFVPESLEWDLEFQNDTPIRQVVNYQKLIDIYKGVIVTIQKVCKHEIHESRFYAGGRLHLAGGIMNCPKCDLRIEGWYCPDSKSHKCDYKQKDGTYNEDDCRYCGHPSERK